MKPQLDSLEFSRIASDVQILEGTTPSRFQWPGRKSPHHIPLPLGSQAVGLKRTGD
jgi:hypothetical protein